MTPYGSGAGRAEFVIQSDQLNLCDDIMDELLVVAALLTMMSAPSERSAVMRDMCSAAIERCQQHTQRLIDFEHARFGPGGFQLL